MTCSSSRRPDRARRSPSACRWSTSSSPAATARGALILAPTRELASQIVDELEVLARARKLRVAAVYGGVGFGPQIAAAKKADILVATPGRLEDLIARGAVALDQVQRARPRRGRPDARHGLPPGGRPDRQPDPRRPPDPLLLGDARGRHRQGRPRLHPPGAVPHPRPDRGRTSPKSSTSSSTSSRRAPSSTSWSPRSATRSRAARSSSSAPSAAPTAWSSGCKAENVEAVAMHGDKSQRQREDALARFERGEVMTLVATDVAARGIDVPDVMRVINYDAPEDRAAYVHRVGRTGRAGRTGTGISFVLAEEVGDMRKIASVARPRVRRRRPAPRAARPRRRPQGAAGRERRQRSASAAAATSARTAAPARAATSVQSSSHKGSGSRHEAAATSRRLERRLAAQTAPPPQPSRLRLERRLATAAVTRA